MPAEEKKSSWKFQSDDRRWGVEKMVPSFVPPYPSRSKTISGFHKYFSVLLCLCVCVCSVAAWTKVAMLQNSSSNIQKWFHYENDLKRRQAMEQVKPNSTRLESTLSSAQLNRTEQKTESRKEKRERRRERGKGSTQLNSAPSPHRVMPLLFGVQIQWHFLSSLLLLRFYKYPVNTLRMYSWAETMAG